MKPPQKVYLYTTLSLMFVIYVVMYMQISKFPEASVEGWGYNTTRDTSQYILSNNLTAHILPERFCDYEFFLLVMVCSSPANVAARNAIRDTWGKERTILGNNVSLFFLLGETSNASLQESVMLESLSYGDVIQERFMDSYNNLTLKSVVMLKLVSGGCLNSSKYLLKIDDDMFVNVHLIVKYLLQRNTTTDLLTGRLICNARPITDARSKWYSPRYMYHKKVYPNYVSGTGYLMSMDVADKLYRTALKTPIFHLEDVYVTGICAKLAGIRPRNNNLFTYHKLSYDPCLFSKLHTAHRFTPLDIRRAYAAVTDGNLTRECQTVQHGGPYTVNRWLTTNILKVNRTYRKNRCE